MPRDTTSRGHSTALRRSARLHPLDITTTGSTTTPRGDDHRPGDASQTNSDKDVGDVHQTQRLAPRTVRTTRRVVATRRQTTIAMPDDALARMLTLAERLATIAQENEVARRTERREAQRSLQEIMQTSARQTEVITTAFGDAMRTQAQQTELVMTMLRECREPPGEH